jgi:hypothetical protein
MIGCLHNLKGGLLSMQDGIDGPMTRFHKSYVDNKPSF